MILRQGRLFLELVHGLRGAVLVASCIAACRPSGVPEQDAGGSREAGIEPPAFTAILRPGAVVQGNLLPRQAVAYRVDLAAGEYLHAALEQRGADVVLSLRDPAGDELLAVDSPNGDRGPEHLFFVAPAAGPYRLEVLPFAPGARGEYHLARESRLATDADHIRARASLAVHAADQAVAAAAPAARHEALHGYTQAIAAWQQSGEGYQEALTQVKLGKTQAALGEVLGAIHCWERAEELLRGLGVESLLPALLNDLGLAYERQGQRERARSCFLVARESARELGNRREEASAINNLSLLEQEAGDFWRALMLLEEALGRWRELGDPQGAATTLHNLGTLYTLLGKLPEAGDSLREALDVYRAAGLRREEAASLMALGWVRFLQGDVAEARAHLSASLDLRRATGDRRGEAVSLDRLGSVSRELDEHERAISEYRSALAIFGELQDRQSLASTLSNLGEALTARGEPDEGLSHQDRALELLDPQSQPSAVAYARCRRARAARALGRPAEGWADVELAIRLLEGIRDRAQSADFRMAYLDSVYEQYELAVDLLMELHGREPARGYDRIALDMSERARARGLLDFVARARDQRVEERLAAGDGRFQELDDRILAVERRQALLLAAGDRTGLAVEEGALRRLLTERARLLVDDGATGGLTAGALRTAEIQRQVVGSQTVLVIYFLGEQRSFVWVVDDRSVESTTLPPRAMLETAALRLHSLLAHSHLKGTERQLRLTAREFSSLLLGPVATRLRCGRQIVVVADGALAYVPFGALPDPEVPDRPLIFRHEVTMLPSVSVLAALRQRAAARRPPAKLVAVVADPVFSREDPRLTGMGDGSGDTGEASGEASADGAVTRSAHDVGLRSLVRLPYTREEAEAILAFSPPHLRWAALGFAASPQVLATEGRLEDFRIVHFATHALVHPTYPELSGIVLSFFDRRGRAQAGFLRSYQILSLRLPADLVVLSACRTGLGHQLKGEGLVGLTQSFFQAGASGVVVSLWDVDDRASATLMERFYRELLREGKPPAAALRAAQVALLQEDRWAAAPYYWAGFVLQGAS